MKEGEESLYCKREHTKMIYSQVLGANWKEVSFG
jgi:hypothetical protein